MGGRQRDITSWIRRDLTGFTLWARPLCFASIKLQDLAAVGGLSYCVGSVSKKADQSPVMYWHGQSH